MTVEYLFDPVQGVIDSPPGHLAVTYDPEFGYPARLSTGSRDIGCGGFHLNCSQLTALETQECDPPTTSLPCNCETDLPAQVYRYLAWDETEELTASGCVALTFTWIPGPFPLEYDVTGDRCVQVHCRDDENSALQGSFRVVGKLDEGSQRFVIDMNAGHADHNIRLEANRVTLQGRLVRGTWSEITIAGTTRHGTFLMDKDPR